MKDNPECYRMKKLRERIQKKRIEGVKRGGFSVCLSLSEKAAHKFNRTKHRQNAITGVQAQSLWHTHTQTHLRNNCIINLSEACSERNMGWLSLEKLSSSFSLRKFVIICMRTWFRQHDQSVYFLNKGLCAQFIKAWCYSGKRTHNTSSQICFQLLK